MGIHCEKSGTRLFYKMHFKIPTKSHLSDCQTFFVIIQLENLKWIRLISLYRSRQIIYNRLNIVINFLLLGIVVYHLLMLSGEANVSEKGIGAIIPLVVIVLLALANKAIIKDDKLVKSVERLR